MTQEKLLKAAGLGHEISPREAWKLFGIMAEFFEATERLQDVKPAVSVFGSARVKPGTRYYQLAEETTVTDIASVLREDLGATTLTPGMILSEGLAREGVRVNVTVADPPAYTPPYDHALCAALAAAGADVTLVTSRFAYGAVPRGEGYRVEEAFYARGPPGQRK